MLSAALRRPGCGKGLRLPRKKIESLREEVNFHAHA